MSSEGLITQGIGAGADEFPLWLLTDGLYIGAAAAIDRVALGLPRGTARAEQRGRASASAGTLPRGTGIALF